MYQLVIPISAEGFLWLALDAVQSFTVTSGNSAQLWPMLTGLQHETFAALRSALLSPLNTCSRLPESLHMHRLTTLSRLQSKHVDQRHLRRIKVTLPSGLPPNSQPAIWQRHRPWHNPFQIRDCILLIRQPLWSLSSSSLFSPSSSWRTLPRRTTERNAHASATTRVHTSAVSFAPSVLVTGSPSHPTALWWPTAVVADAQVLRVVMRRRGRIVFVHASAEAVERPGELRGLSAWRGGGCVPSRHVETERIQPGGSVVIREVGREEMEITMEITMGAETERTTVATMTAVMAMRKTKRLGVVRSRISVHGTRDNSVV